MDARHEQIASYIRSYRESKREWPLVKVIANSLPQVGSSWTVRRLIRELDRAGIVQRPGRGQWDGVKLLDYKDDRPTLARRIKMLEDELTAERQRANNFESHADQLQVALSETRYEVRYLRNIVKKMRIRAEQRPHAK
jgi:hypothetical protein